MGSTGTSDQIRLLWRQWQSSAISLISKSDAGSEVIRIHAEALTHVLHAVASWWKCSMRDVRVDGDPLSNRIAESHRLNEEDWVHLIDSGVLGFTCDVLQSFRSRMSQQPSLPVKGDRGSGSCSPLLTMQNACLMLVDIILGLVQGGHIPIKLHAR